MSDIVTAPQACHRLYTQLEGNDNVIVLCNYDGDEWDDDIDESVDAVSPAARKAGDEWKKYCTIYKHSSVLPEVKSSHTAYLVA